MEPFNIFSQVQGELEDFFTEKVKIASATVDGRITGGFPFSQWETIKNIEFVDNSKFMNSVRDKEGQIKFFLNTASFRKEVASKNIDIDVKNFNFVPEDGQPEFPAIIARKKFRKWAKDEGLSDKINDTVDRFPKYGTIVAKKVGKDVVIVPLGKIRNQQDAKSLATASYVIEEHTDLCKSDFEYYPDWDTSEIDFKKWDTTVTVYERYGYVPAKFLKENGGTTAKVDTENVYAMVVITIDKSKKASGKSGVVLFCEETECPYIERHYARQDGRWLGIGEIEKQIDNQAARNMIFNLRKKALGWGSKAVFGSSDDTDVNNLSMEVRDGDILKLSNNNSLWRIDTTTKANVDFNSMDELVEKNSDQRSFTFEVATGESMTSGTPFRLGALLANSVNTYYDKKRETLGLFWKDIVIDFMIPMWIKQTPEEFIEGVLDTEEGFEDLRQAKRDYLITDAIVNAVAEGRPVDLQAIEMAVDAGLNKISRDYYKMTRKDIKELKYRIDLDITGESIDLPKKIETLTTLYQGQLQMQDFEAAKATQRKILSLTGERVPKTVIPMSSLMSQQNGPTQMDNKTMMMKKEKTSNGYGMPSTEQIKPTANLTQ